MHTTLFVINSVSTCNAWAMFFKTSTHTIGNVSQPVQHICRKGKTLINSDSIQHYSPAVLQDFYHLRCVVMCKSLPDNDLIVDGGDRRVLKT